ncbi:MAG: hypothetical protein ACREID_08350, partial [Planctomycetota bacterium]
MTRRAAAALGLLAAFALAGPGATDLAERKKQLILDAFFGAVGARADVDAATREKILAMREGAVLVGEYSCIHQALLLLYDEYRRADALLLNERYAGAAEAFGRLQGSSDPYLAAYAKYRYGLAELNREQFEKAAAAFTSVLNEHPREAGCDVEAAFYRAIALGQSRDKENALVASMRFLEDYPDAPERYRQAMEQMLNELLQEWESPLYDLSGRMGKAARVIEGGDTGTNAQGEQREIVSILDELIKQAEA